MNIILAIILIIIGIILINLNSLSKQNNGSTCNRCGTTIIGNKCPKCGYQNYEKDDFKSNSFLGKFGFIILVGGIIMIPLSFRMGKNKISNNIINYFKGNNTVDNRVEVNPAVDNNTVNNQVEVTEPDENRELDNKVDELINNIINNVVKNDTKKSTNNNKNNTVKKYSITTSGEGLTMGTCKVNSFKASVSSAGTNMIKLSYSVNISESSKEDPDNKFAFKLCSYTIYVYDSNNKQIEKHLGVTKVNYGQSTTTNNFIFIKTSENNFKAVIKEK